MSDKEKHSSQSSGSKQGQYKAGPGPTYPGDTHITTNHDIIKKWVEERGGSPAVAKDTEGGRPGGFMVINFPGYSGKQSLQDISWSDFFKQFDQRHLAFMYQDRMENGQVSRFNQLVSQHTAQADEEEKKHSQTVQQRQQKHSSSPS